MTGRTYSGLFGYIGTGGIIKNLTVAEANITASSGNSMGIIAGVNTGDIENCTVSGGITTTSEEGYSNASYLGGIAGQNESSGKITNCVNRADVYGYDFLGGVVGSNNGGTVENCRNYGTIIGIYFYIGGIAGYGRGDYKITNCANEGSVSGASVADSRPQNIGGIVGYGGAGSVTNCVNSGEVSGSYDFVGGIMGASSGGDKITNCVSTGEVSGNGSSYVGGIIGHTGGATLGNCAWLEGTAGKGVGGGTQPDGVIMIGTSAGVSNIATALSASIDKTAINPNAATGDADYSATISLVPFPGKLADVYGTGVKDAGATTDSGIINITDNGNGTFTVTPTGTASGSAQITVTADLYKYDFASSSYSDTEYTQYTFTLNVIVSDIELTQITLSPASDDVSMKIGETQTFSVSYKPTNATNKSVTWSASPDGIVSITDSGNGAATVAAVAAGETTLSVTSQASSALTDTCRITVTPVYAENVTISPDVTETLYLDGSSHAFTATVSPANATNRNVTWSLTDVSGTLVQNGDVSISGGATDNPVTVSTKNAASAGSVKLTATAAGGDPQGGQPSGELTLDFALPNVSGLALNAETLDIDLNVAAYGELEAQVSPSNAQYSAVTWSVEPPIASISYDGDKQTKVTITPSKGGTATVTASVGGYSDTCTLTVTPIYATGLTLSSGSLSLESGTTAALTAAVTPDNATDRSVTWTTSDAAVVSVDENGTVSAHDAGSATITATANGAREGAELTARCIVTVTLPPVPVEDIDIDASGSTALTVGGTVKFTATVTPPNATNPAVTWASSDESVATVDAEGLVTARGEGTATITATSIDGSVAASVTVTVAAAEPAPAPQPSGGGGGGCSAGWGALALLAIVPLAIKRRK